MEKPLKQLKFRQLPCAFLIPGIAVSYRPSVHFLKDSMIFRKRANDAGLGPFVETVIGSRQESSQLWDDDNLILQKLSYIVNSTIADQCQENGIAPNVIVGYSMGLYAALYAAGFYAFETGLEIVEKAYHLVRGYCLDQSCGYGMGLLLGFSQDEINSLLLDDTCGKVTVAMRNGRRSFVIAGDQENLDVCLEKAHREGALCSRRLAARYPYHTGLLGGMEKDFSDFLESLPYFEPHTPVPSLVTGRIIDRTIVAEEIAKAMCSPLELDSVVTTLASRFGIEYGIDIGPQQSMKKLVRYIDSSLKVHPYPEVLLQ